MTFWTRLLAIKTFVVTTAVVDAIDPPEPVDDLRELRQLRGLSEIHHPTIDNLYHFDRAYGPTIADLERRGWVEKQRSRR